MERSTLMTTKERRVRASVHFLYTNGNQVALQLQTDCTTRHIKQNLVNCCTIVGTRSTTNPHEIKVMQLEHCGRRTCVRLATRRSEREVHFILYTSTSVSPSVVGCCFRSAILVFEKKFINLTVNRLYAASMRHGTEFHQNRSKGCRDMAI